MAESRADIDLLVDRLNALDSQPGFCQACVETYVPPTIRIDFDDNASADKFVMQQCLTDPALQDSILVDPPHGSTVRWRR